MMEDTTKNITCSVVIPVFNSMSTLEPLVQRLEKVLDNLISDYEIILVMMAARMVAGNYPTHR